MNTASTLSIQPQTKGTVSMFTLDAAPRIEVIPIITKSVVTVHDPFKGLENNPYYINKFGDEYAFVDELGFEHSYMGPRADMNHLYEL